MASHTILITSATGQQGTATIAALLRDYSSSDASSLPVPKIIALTRSAKSAKASLLKEKFPHITLFEGSTSQPQAVFVAHPGITSIFLVTNPPDEEPQALPLIDTAISHGVKHITFSSVDRGGDEKSWETPTTVSHFASKHHIEQHLRSASERDGSHTSWTILRPTGFMDNYKPGTFGKLMATLWATMPSDRKMQLVSTHDVGVFAAQALMDREKWVGRAIGLAGDELTFGEAREMFKRSLGYDMPVNWTWLGRTVRWAVEDAGQSMQWFEDVGFGVDLVALRDGYPLQTFETWLRASWKDTT
ncbi:NmrA-like family protein [Seiridium cupressi]